MDKDILEKAIILLEDNQNIKDDGNLFKAKDILPTLIEHYNTEYRDKLHCTCCQKESDILLKTKKRNALCRDCFIEANVKEQIEVIKLWTLERGYYQS